eukprot:444583_1
MECLLVWMALPLLEARRYCTSICTDRQYMDLKVDVLLDRFMNWPSLFQFINDLCHQYELALDVPLRNNIFEWTHNELTKTVLHPLAYGSNRYLELKNLMGKSFKTIRSIKEVKFHSHKRKNYEAMDNNCISLRHCYLQTMKAHPPRNISKPSKDYKQWKLQASILSSLHYNCMNKLAVSIYEFIDTISQQYQSPNHPWHNMRKDTDDVAVFYMMITNVFRNYMDELDSMDNEQFMQRTHLFNAQILALFPDLKSLYIQGDGVFVDGPLDRIFAVYHKKKYKNDKEKEQYESKRDELLQIHTGVELQITAIQKLCVAYCYVCGEKNWNSIQIECVSCRHMVHIKCVDPMNNKDAAWYKEQNINYVCPRHALDDNEDDQDDNEQHDLNLQCECTVGSLARQSLTLSSNETYTCDGCQTALIAGSIVYDCEECGFGMCEECLVLLRSENHAESTAIEDRNADLLKLEDLFIGLYDSNGLEIVECDALTITKLVVKSMVKSSELIVSGLHFCLRYPSWIDEIHSIFLIRYYLKDECSEETLLFLTKLAEDYLSSHRSPLTTHRSKYGIHGEVLTKLMRSADAKVDLTELVAQLHALKSINITDLNNNSDEDIDVEMDVSLNDVPIEDEEMYDEGVMHDESVLHDGNTAGLNIEMDLSESEHSEEEKHDILDDDL